ncbi:agouti-signaling protein isoform X2 [Oryzias melastigma]|uniref:agouti-signaling protein isoform X2 n=1 Tax=Oryzias melastigma TaxID=30732 RepID=UPI000CF7D322|nr:agouti-signaling protein isoform X2 [Oryzias melastigma]
MKAVILFLCFLHLTFVGSSPHPKPRHIWLSEEPTVQSKGSTNPVRVGPLFARRGLYEYQQLLVPTVEIPPSQNDILHTKVEQKPIKPGCSQLGQSCSRLSGCCDACATCHCRFFSAICFCRKANGLCERKRLNSSKARQRQKQIHSVNQ